MNAISKKLLSMLVVVAMVLSMVPFGGLSIFAVETEATEVASSTVTPGQANLPEGISTTNPVDNSDAAIDAHIAAGTCPMCNQTGITWEKKTININGAANDQEQHYYYELADGEAATTYTIGTNTLGMTNSNSRLCIAVKSGVTLKNTKYRSVMMGGSGNTLNIMGTGTILSDQITAKNDDFGVMQLGGGTSTARNTVNLYGCTFTHVTNQNATNDNQAILRIQAATVTVNMWDGAIIGPATVDTTKWSHNVRVDGGIFNMYGGTIRNGVSKTNGISGNVTIANSGKMYMYGGTISGGNYSATGVVGGNVVVGGRKQAATSSSAGSFYMYGGTITGGSSANDGNGGGNIVNYNGGGDMHLLGGIIENGNAAWGGGNVSVQAGTAAKNVIGGTVLIRNGTITGNNGANVVVRTGLTMSGGFIQGDSAVQKTGNGGGICLYTGATLNMTGGEISNMNVAGTGGAIYAAAGSSETPTTVTIGGTAVLDNNQAASFGGNVHLNGANCILSVTGGTIKNGHTTGTNGSGGNLSGATGSTINVSGGSIFGGYNPSGNDGASWGGNIRSYQATVNISGGYIYNGYAKDSTDLDNYTAGNIGVMGGTATTATLNISGGHIGGDIGFSKANVKLSGAPEIKYDPISLPDGTKSNTAHYNGIPVGNNSNIDISELQTGAQIQVTGSVGAVFTAAHENAANVVGCFTSTAGNTRKIVVNAENKLEIAENTETVKTPEVGTFNPWDCEGMAYCPACMAQGKTEAEALVKWSVYAGGNDSSNPLQAYMEDGTTVDYSGHLHVYLDEDLTYTTQALVTNRKICFNLNGHSITPSVDTATYAISGTNLINLMDTEGGAVVTGGAAASATMGAALHINGANASAQVHIYGGTYTKAEANTVSPVVIIYTNGGYLNIHGGTIDADGLTGSAIRADGKSGGSNPAVITMDGGEIKGGTAAYGGSVFMNTSVVSFTMSGGKVSGGTATTAGGNISAPAGSSVTISGGTLCDGYVSTATEGTNWGGNIRAWNANVTISGGLIYGGNGGKQLAGANIACYSDANGRTAGNGKLTISGGTIVGDVAISNGAGSGFMTLSGAPKIVTSMEIEGETVNAVDGGLSILSTYTADISGLSAEADIAVTAGLNVVLTDAHENAANVVGCFKPTNTAFTVALQADNTLKVVEAVKTPVVGTFNPWECDGMAYCDACLAQGKTEAEALVEWTVYAGENGSSALTGASGAHFHMYLEEDQTYSSKFMITYRNVCLNLNGCDVTAETGATIAFQIAATAIINFIDTKGGAVVTGNIGDTTGLSGAAIHVNGSSVNAGCNIYGGTFTKLESDTKSPIVLIGTNGGTINMYDGAVIDATNTTTADHTKYEIGAAVELRGTAATDSAEAKTAKFTMYGGEIKGGTAKTGGAVRLSTAAVTFKMVDGEISGGTANGNGGTIYAGNGVVDISGGEIKGGTAAYGGLLYANSAVVNISGDAILNGGTATSHGACITANTGSVINITGGTIYGGTSAGQGGTLRAYEADVNMSGGTMYAGTANGTKTHCVWLVDSDMVMSGNATVYAPANSTDNYGAISVAKSKTGSSLILSGNATVKSVSGESKNSIYVGYNNKLMIANDWTGEAYCSIINASKGGYARGENITAADANHYVGALTDGVVIKGGTFTGKLYYGPQNNAKIFGDDGNLVIGMGAVVTADGEEWFLTNQEAVDAATAGYPNAYALMGGNAEVTLSGDTIIESRGYDVTVNGTGNLYALDRANDDYAGYGTWIVNGGVIVAEEATNPDNGNRYIVIKNTAGENKYSSHRIEVKLTAVTLRASEAGLYYKASYKCDATLAGRVSAYGVAVSTNVTPGANFLEDYTNNIGFSCLENFADVHETTGESAFTVNATSGSVFGIFKTAAERPATADMTTAQLNAKYGKMKIYANTYFLVDTKADEDADNDYVVVSDTENGGTQNGIGYSLWDALVAVDGMWNELGDKQALIEDFYNTWKNEIDIKDGVEDSDFAWDLTQLPNIFAALSASN